jgi:putative hydrolase of the HAD superfamily
LAQGRMIAWLFLDIGGVLLSDGWPRQARQRAAAKFGLDYEDFESRHLLMWDMHQKDSCTLDEYLERTVFYRTRAFTHAQFRDFMLAQSTPCPDMIHLVRRLKAKYGLKLAAISNEGRELNAHRIAQFKLDEIFDLFVSSCYVRLLKPDPAIFRLALDVAQVSPSSTLYIENTPMFVEVAAGLGIRGIVHEAAAMTSERLASFALTCGEGAEDGWA